MIVCLVSGAAAAALIATFAPILLFALFLWTIISLVRAEPGPWYAQLLGGILIMLFFPLILVGKFLTAPCSCGCHNCDCDD
jgi:hypothetical protein